MESFCKLAKAAALIRCQFLPHELDWSLGIITGRIQFLQMEYQTRLCADRTAGTSTFVRCFVQYNVLVRVR